jgi:hypothetical protein
MSLSSSLIKPCDPVEDTSDTHSVHTTKLDNCKEDTKTEPMCLMSSMQEVMLRINLRNNDFSKAQRI